MKADYFQIGCTLRMQVDLHELSLNDRKRIFCDLFQSMLRDSSQGALTQDAQSQIDAAFKEWK